MIAEAFGGNNTSGPIEIATALNACASASGRMDFETETFVATTLRARDLSRGVDSDCTDTLVTHSLRGEGFDASEDGTGRGTPLVPVAVPILEAGARTGISTTDPRAGIGIGGDPMFTLQAGKQHAVAFAQNQRNEVRTLDVAGALAAEPGTKQQTYLAFNMHKSGNAQSSLGIAEDHTDCLRAFEKSPFVVHSLGMAVRRLTPRECERLQGFPDDYTLIPWRRKAVENCPDGPRYRALGNSMAVPVMHWIGSRIKAMI